MNPRQEHEQAIEQQHQCQQRVDEARRELNRQRRELDRALPYDHQQDERNRRLEPAREVFRQRQAQVDAAQRVREQKYDAIPDKTDEDGGKYWNWKAPGQRPR